MKVERTHHIDASEPDSAGMYEYYYEYDIYQFTDANCSLTARSYSDDPDAVHFLSMAIDGPSRLMVDKDLLHPLFLAAHAYLQADGKLHFKWLSGRGDGYEPVPSRT